MRSFSASSVLAAWTVVASAQAAAVTTSSMVYATVANSSTSTMATATSMMSAPSSVATTCTAAWVPQTAAQAFAELNPGWNLGNTLDATPDETSWGNPFTVPSFFEDVQARGFKSVRIPVTWAYHFVDASPTWNVNATWMDRVETVVDEALALGFSVILNAHHDSWIWADFTAAGANYTMIEEKFGRLWDQIGARFACKSSKLIFEPLNEPVGTTQADADKLNNLSAIFLDSINKAGGYNSQRVVSLSGLGMDSIKTSEWFVRPTTYPDQPWGLQFHYYSPYQFIFDAWGATVWGSAADKASLENDFALFHGNFSNVPAFIGEWSAAPTSLDKSARWVYTDYFIRTCSMFNYSSVLWDNGIDYFNRLADTWTDDIQINILIDAVKGVSNTLPISTTDLSATTEQSSAYLFHKVGDPITAQSVPYALNGNSLVAIETSEGLPLLSSQYSLSSAGVLTLTASYLGSLYPSNSTAGLKETLTMTFSAGASLSLQIYQYDTPVFPQTMFKIDKSLSSLSIPVQYKGLDRVAAVKAVLADGTFLADAWTVYLPVMQQGRWTYGNWQWDSNNFIIEQSGLQTMAAAGQTVTLTVEFFPRILGQNSVNLTFTQ